MYFFRNLKVDYRENCALLRYYADITDVSGQPIGPIFRGQESGFMTPEDGITTTRCVITRKNAVLIHFAAEACNNALIIVAVCLMISQINQKHALPACSLTLLSQRCLVLPNILFPSGFPPPKPCRHFSLPHTEVNKLYNM